MFNLQQFNVNELRNILRQYNKAVQIKSIHKLKRAQLEAIINELFMFEEYQVEDDDWNDMPGVRLFLKENPDLSKIGEFIRDKAISKRSEKERDRERRGILLGTLSDLDYINKVDDYKALPNKTATVKQYLDRREDIITRSKKYYKDMKGFNAIEQWRPAKHLKNVLAKLLKDNRYSFKTD